MQILMCHFIMYYYVFLREKVCCCLNMGILLYYPLLFSEYLGLQVFSIILG